MDVWRDAGDSAMLSRGSHLQEPQSLLLVRRQLSSHKNSLRVAVVWMDDYSKYFYERTGSHKRSRPLSLVDCSSYALSHWSITFLRHSLIGWHLIAALEGICMLKMPNTI